MDLDELSHRVIGSDSSCSLSLVAAPPRWAPRALRGPSRVFPGIVANPGWKDPLRLTRFVHRFDFGCLQSGREDGKLVNGTIQVTDREVRLRSLW